ncbi:MAG: hypothetical protein ACI4EO_07765 [Blautia sp.]
MNNQRKVVEQMVDELRSKGIDISDDEIHEAEQHCLRKMEVAKKPEEYFEILFPDVLKEYLFRRTVNAISFINMMEVGNVQCMFTESVSQQLS